METEQAEVKPDKRPWEFMTNCRMLQLYGQDKGMLALLPSPSASTPGHGHGRLNDRHEQG
jgi:hypothetical protein